MTSLFSRSKRGLRTGAGLLGAALMLASHAVPAAGTAQPQYTGDLIIKWRDDTSGTRKPLSATEASNRLLSVAQAAGNTLQVKRTLATDAQLMRTGLSDAAGIEAAAAKVAQDARVAYAVPDRILYPTATPNDPLFLTQNNLQSPTVVAGGINVASAWDITQGSSSLVVAVVDTGYTDHPDLSGKILPGYNFISDPARAGNSTGRGSDAHDTGDGVTSADVSAISGCTSSDIGNSTWHGTEVMSVLAAGTNNALDIAGVGWNTRIVPVRTSGKCGALLSDTVDGMLWAGGISVSGVPANPNPARVINVSLGSVGSCSAAEQDAINRLAALGTVVVAAAGNEGSAVDAPANCSGAIAVTAHVDSGENASYANVGSQVALSAPGGGCANSQVTSNGCTGPVSVIQADSNDGQYSLGNYVVKSVAGTSFSTPEVAGTIALMLSVQSQLSNAQILAGLQQTARAHPSGTFCATRGGCGAGLLDTAGAVRYAQTTTPAGIGSGSSSSSSSGSSSSSSGGGGAAAPSKWPARRCCWQPAWRAAAGARPPAEAAFPPLARLARAGRGVIFRALPAAIATVAAVDHIRANGQH